MGGATSPCRAGTQALDLEQRPVQDKRRNSHLCTLYRPVLLEFRNRNLWRETKLTRVTLDVLGVLSFHEQLSIMYIYLFPLCIVANLDGTENLLDS